MNIRRLSRVSGAAASHATFPRLAAALSAIGLAVSALPGSTSAAASPANGFVSYSGTATDPHSGKFLYGEHHVLAYRDNRIAERIVLYTCGDGSAFARKTVSYITPLAPDFSLDDASNGMREGVKTEGGLREAFFRGAGSNKEKDSALPDLPGLVADAGFDEFVRENWGALMAGKTLGMPFWVPSSMRDMEFDVRHVRSEPADDGTVEVIRLKLSNWLGSIFPSIDVYYGSADHVLRRYVGVSDLRDTSNSNFQTQIAFPPDVRKRSSEQELDGALHTKLAPCK